MSVREGEFIIRRIVVALDASRHSLAALEAAAGLASGAEAELLGVFVEDINLLRLASLPFARQLSYHAASEEPLDAVRMERELRVKAEQARRSLERAAERARVQWSFRVVRGGVVTALLAAASEADVLIVGKGEASRARRALGSTACAVTAKPPQALLLMQHGVPLGAAPLLIYDGSAGSRQAACAAIRLAIAFASGLTTLVLAAAQPDFDELMAEVYKLVEGTGVQLQFRKLPAADAASLFRAIHQEPKGVVVLSARGVLGEAAVRKLLHEIENPVLFIGAVEGLAAP